MRQLIIDRLNEININERGFTKATSRWRNMQFEGNHVSLVSYELLNDKNLLKFYEVIIRQLYKQF